MGLFRWTWQKSASEQECAEFRELCLRLSALLKSTGRTVKPYTAYDVPRFKSYKHHQEALGHLRNYVEVLESAQKDGIHLDDNKQVLWRMLKRMGLTPQHDVFDQITDEDTVEIYTVNNWQIFRNMKFFDFVSMSVEEMCTLVWNRDTERDLKITWDLLDLAFRVRMGLLRKTTSISHIPDHSVKELLGERWTVGIAMKIISPLAKDGRMVAALTTNRSRVISKGLVRDEINRV